MRIVVIGGTGHIGTFLVPRLVRGGHDVVVVSRGQRKPYVTDPIWDRVEQVVIDREVAEREGRFGRELAALDPAAVVDLTCFTVDSARQLVEAAERRWQLVHTGSVWAYGRSTIVPTTEDTPKQPYGEYGINKAALEDYLLREQDQVAATVIHPGHISGPGWTPINPAGHLDLEVFRTLINDGRAVLPERGMGLLQHVHADDVAAIHQAAIEQPEAAAGQAFNAVAEQSLTLRGYAELIARAYGHEPELEFLDWPAFVERVGADHAAVTADHIDRGPHHSMAKAGERLGFRPAYSAADTVLEATAWLAKHELGQR